MHGRAEFIVCIVSMVIGSAELISSNRTFHPVYSLWLQYTLKPIEDAYWTSLDQFCSLFVYYAFRFYTGAFSGFVLL